MPLKLILSIVFFFIPYTLTHSFIHEVFSFFFLLPSSRTPFYFVPLHWIEMGRRVCWIVKCSSPLQPSTPHIFKLNKIQWSDKCPRLCFTTKKKEPFWWKVKIFRLHTCDGYAMIFSLSQNDVMGLVEQKLEWWYFSRFRHFWFSFHSSFKMWIIEHFTPNRSERRWKKE